MKTEQNARPRNHHGGRMTKWKGKAASMAPLALFATVSVAALSIGTAAVATTITSALTSPQVFSTDVDHAITSSGSISISSSATAALTISLDYSSAFTNDGTISVAGTSIDTATGLYLNGNLLAGGSIINNGTVLVDYSLSNNSYMSAFGVHIGGGVEGTLANNGTITVTAQQNYTGTDYDVSAYGIYAGTVGAAGRINNTGTINVSALNVNTSTATAYGIYLNGSLAGEINNSGSITATAFGTDYDAEAYGIYVIGDVSASGLINNTGTITAKAQMTISSSASVYGVYVSGNMDGQINNSGTVTALAETSGSYDSATAYGFRIYGNLNGDFNNSGTIISTARVLDTSGDEALAYGLYVGSYGGGDAVGNITNSGSITVLAEGNTSGTAYGVKIYGDLLGNFDNSGSISVTATDNSSEASAYGLYVGGVATGHISNSGSITVRADGDTSGTAYGVKISGGLDGGFDNSGSISVTATDNSSEASAYGLSVSGGGVNSAISNSGSITVRADGATSGTAYGINMWGSLNDVLDNSGSITVTATDRSSSARAWGINVGGDVSGAINNSGTIAADATYTTGYGRAYGIKVGGTLTGGISNSGTISANVNASSGNGARGVYIGDLVGGFSNTGTITAAATGGVNAYGLYVNALTGTLGNIGRVTATATGSGTAYGIYLAGGAGTLNLNNTDQVVGLIHVADHDVNLTSIAGPNAYFEFEDANTALGVFTTAQNGGSPWFITGAGGANPTYATYDQSLLSGQGFAVNQVQGLSDHLGELSSSVGTGTVAKNYMTVSTKGTAGSAADYHPFIQAQHAYAGYNTASSSKSQVNSLALQGGVIVGLNNGGNVGFMLSGIDSHTQTNSRITGFKDNSTDGTGFALDLAYTPDLSFGSLTFGASFGQLAQDQQRFLAGGTFANSSYNVSWYGASAKFARSFSQGSQGWSLIPSAKFSITRVDFDGYTETGTAVTLATVGNHSSTVTSGELGIKMAKQFSASAVSLGVSAFSTNWSGNTASSVTMLGSTQAVNAVNQDLSGAAISLNLDSVKIAGGDFSVRTKTSFDSDGGVGTSITARFEMSF